VERKKEMRVPITFSLLRAKKTIATTALLDTGAMATYISLPLRPAAQHPYLPPNETF